MSDQTDLPDVDPTQAVTSNAAPATRLDKALALVPRALSSHAHIIFLGCLGVYLVLLPLLGVDVSAKAELIGGNYTNVTSDLGACIAAGLTVHLVKRDRKRSQEVLEILEHMRGHHEALAQDIARAVTAAERAEAAASTSGSS